MSTSTQDPFARKFGQYANLTDAEREALRAAAEAHARTLGLHEDVVHQGEAVSQCCLVREGVLARYKLLPEGRRQITAFLVPGDWCDLAGFLSGHVEFGVVALGPARVACVPHRVLHALCAAYPNLTRALWGESVREAEVAREWIVNVGQRTAEQRFAHLLCELHQRFAAAGLTDPEDGGFAWPVTQTEMADATGMTSVHVNRTLRALRGMGLLDYDARRVVLRDEAHLRRLGGFDAAYLGLQAAS